MKGLRSFARLCMFIALLGFIATVIVNLSHRPDIARPIFVFSCICTVVGLLITYLSPATPAVSGDAALLRVQERLALLGSAQVLGGLILRWFFYPGGEALISAGLVLMVVFVVVFVYRLVIRRRQGRGA